MGEVQRLKEQNERLLKDIKDLEEQLRRSAYYKEGHFVIEAVERGHKIEKLEKEIKILKNEIQKLKDENKLLRSNKGVKGSTELKIHNERGAGRKSRFTDQEKETMKLYRIQGKTIKEIAEMYSCSVGLVHKLISEDKRDL
ncbi:MULTISPECIES: Hin recombinase [unclassified Clostridium]|uniref:Hin recombinase n=1 Tax=unclassified Clostridium TaxID=2614128 RepID=UPI0025C72F29|nr:Hin recombinase [Clostridium sp.]MDY4251007.1 Hin recombinase [Clostridium sp.]